MLPQSYSSLSATPLLTALDVSARSAPLSSVLRRALAAAVGVLAMAAAHGATEVAEPAREIERLFRAGDSLQAFQRLDQALAAQGGNVRLRFLQAVMFSESRRSAEAAAAFERLTQDYPELPEPYNNLAVLAAADGQLDRARELLETALRCDPAYYEALQNLGDVHLRLALRAYEQAGASPRADAGLQRKLQLTRQLAQR